MLSFYLIWSVLISLSVIVIGVVEYLTIGSTGYVSVPLDILIKSGGGSTVVFPHYLGTIIFGVVKLKSFAIIQLGILLLLLSPIGRIFLQILIYVKEKDRPFIAIATVVFVILLISLYLSKYIA
ncbi:MAG: DUF1634 domain-containing protein [Thermoplasmatales archaeon]|jgi:uncharacterized membrane protein|nr:DUF1634 domain-containing protein [Candidatus Thermoplasmatota archaeon]MCL6003595.1 DUF1634 domain-containing protein [Candidatus Thermoplasmatota archaeon]MDA8054760.1 DUF1634 domain-containing protein [Thermoplasmatales archaeon]